MRQNARQAEMLDRRLSRRGTGDIAMNDPFDLAHTPTAQADFSDDDGFGDFMQGDGLEHAALYQEIAERRAQLECAETLRRARAL
jgi:hypothetical protein